MPPVKMTAKEATKARRLKPAKKLAKKPVTDAQPIKKRPR